MTFLTHFDPLNEVVQNFFILQGIILSAKGTRVQNYRKIGRIVFSPSRSEKTSQEQQQQQQQQPGKRTDMGGSVSQKL